jgi:hypothetical protein
VSRPDPQALHETYGQELTGLLDGVLAGDLMSDRASLERQVVRVVGALLWLHQRHRVDEHGRCSICWPLPRTWWWPWPRRSTCTVHSSLSFHLRQPDRFILAALTDDQAPVRDTS